jgi:hypothetical protein
VINLFQDAAKSGRKSFSKAYRKAFSSLSSGILKKIDICNLKSLKILKFNLI